MGKKHQRKQKETKDKESQQWLDAEHKASENRRTGQTIITVADREADIFDLFGQVAAGDGEFQIRASHNRCVKSELSYLIPTIEAATIAGYTTVNIGRNPVNAAREARLSIQFMTTEIHSPAGRKLAQFAPPVTVNVILATEVNPPAGVEPIRWLLLTTLAVESVAAAMTCIRYYTLRWLIERYHYTLKSDCQLEQLQLETADRIKRAFVTYSLVAW